MGGDGKIGRSAEGARFYAEPDVDVQWWAKLILAPIKMEAEPSLGLFDYHRLASLPSEARTRQLMLRGHDDIIANHVCVFKPSILTEKA